MKKYVTLTAVITLIHYFFFRHPVTLSFGACLMHAIIIAAILYFLVRELEIIRLWWEPGNTNKIVSFFISTAVVTLIHFFFFRYKSSLRFIDCFWNSLVIVGVFYIIRAIWRSILGGPARPWSEEKTAAFWEEEMAAIDGRRQRAAAAASAERNDRYRAEEAARRDEAMRKEEAARRDEAMRKEEADSAAAREKSAKMDDYYYQSYYAQKYEGTYFGHQASERAKKSLNDANNL